MACIIPLTFERYAKVLHRFTVSEDSVDPSLTEEELAILQIPDCLSIKHLTASRPKGQRIFWKEAAQALDVPYSQEITHGWFSRSLAPAPQCWPRFIDGPAGGVLDVEECSELVSILVKNSSEDACSFRLPEIPFIGTDQSLLFEGMLEEVPAFFADYRFGPEYWWPRDHQWCACSDYDLTFTVVGDHRNSSLRFREVQCSNVLRSAPRLELMIQRHFQRVCRPDRSVLINALIVSCGLQTAS